MKTPTFELGQRQVVNVDFSIEKPAHVHSGLLVVGLQTQDFLQLLIRLKTDYFLFLHHFHSDLQSLSVLVMIWRL